MLLYKNSLFIHTSCCLFLSLLKPPRRPSRLSKREGHVIETVEQCELLFLLWILVEVIYQMPHNVVWQGAVPRLGAALGIHGVLSG